MKRYSDWQARLTTYFNDVSHLPFEWGTHDCSLFVAGAVLAQTGVDIAEPFRGKYTDKTGAAQALRVYGAGTLQRTFNNIFGKSKHVAQAKRGDVVLHAGAVGICCGAFSRFIGSIDESANSIVADGSEDVAGLIAIPTRLCTKAWTVAF
jgi:hypothetical protein